MKCLRVHSSVLFAAALGLLLAASPAPSGAALPFITEIVPANARTLSDEDGAFPDWIEIHNPGPGAVNLQGWFLTDTPLVLSNWAFPSVNLPAGGYLVVFASGKDRTNNPALLHTSFQLEASGEYLALVMPDGVTIASAFSPAFPSVKEDVGFGVAQSQIVTSLLDASVPRTLVPANAGDLPPDWNLASYVPGAQWSNGVAPPAVGFDTNTAAGLPANSALSGAAIQSTLYQGSQFPATLAINNLFSDFTHTFSTDTSPFWQVTLTNEMAIHGIVLFNRGGGCCQWRLRDITVEIVTTNQSGSVTNWISPLLNPENVLGSPAYLSNNLVTITGGPVVGRTVIVHRTPDPDNSGAGTGTATDDMNVLSLGEVQVFASGAPGLRPYFTTDIQTQMWNSNSSAFIRLPFVSTNTPDVLTFNVRYDDGYIAYLNGTEIARRNAPASPQWDSAATADRTLASAIMLETIDVSAAIGALVNGTNILGVQLMNSSVSDGNALFQPQLIATRVVVTSNVFFDTATPGIANTTPWYLDEVADTHFTVDRGFFTNAFTLEITNVTPGSQIYYSFNADEPSPAKGTLYTGPLSITNTTVVRARAFRENWKATDVDTASYIFIADVIRQVPNWPADRIPPRYFPASWGANSVDYGMDPDVINAYTLAQWYEALTQIPSMSIVTEMGHLFDATTGIYANASGHGEDWERPMSLELLDPSQPVPGQFQENGGLRIRGGFSRNPQFFKHSFRLFFNRDYGAGTLEYPLFGDAGAQYFDKFDLRTSQNYSWPRNESPTFDTMVREVFCRQTLGDMGQQYRRSRYYHLYLNGQYWGLYETDERPSAYYGEAYFGGSKTNFDVVKCGNRSVTPNFATEATDGNFTAWSNLWVMCQILRTNASTSNYFRPLGCNPDGTRNPNLEVLIDADNLIDYMMGIFFMGDGDATLSAFLGNVQPNNWFGMRDRTNPDVGFRFFNSDCEHTLGSPSSQVDRTGPFGGPGVANEGIFMWSNPQWMHEELARNLEYRVRFGDHIQKHLFNGGALTLQACTNRFIAKASQITKAIRAYSARWGDAVRASPPYGESDWNSAITFCLNWLTNRGNLVLAQLTNDLLFPTITAPSFNSYGGFVSPGFTLILAQGNPGGAIHYTLDGTDPRLVGGATSAGALTYSAPVTLDGNVSVRARVKVGTNWSAAVEAIFTTAQYFRDLAITEIMYNPVGTTNVDGDEFEFLEVKNTGTNNLNLSALAFTGGVTFNFTNGTRLGPGAFFVLARNKAQFQSRYPGVPVNGVYSGRLDNAGESVTLSHRIGGALFSVSYDDSAEWPQAADGFGFSLVPASTTTNLNSDKPYHWRASTASGGSPGADDPAAVIPVVLINEVLTHTMAVAGDFIELHNPSGGAVSVGGWFLSDAGAVPKKYRIADGTMIQGGGFLVFTEADFNPTPGLGTSFTLSAEGEQVFLFSGDAMTNLTGWSHGFAFGAAAEGVTFGRHVISTGEEQFPAQLSPTSNGANSAPLIPDVVISEIHYNPRPGGDAFIEIQNRSVGSVPLYDPLRPTNTWRLNGIDFIFPTSVVLSSGDIALVVETQPAAFRAKYGVPANIPVFGPYGGRLEDNGELVELQRLDFRGTNNTAWVTLDAVRYNDRAPWPTAADGAGASLQRINAGDYGNDPVNWRAAMPTPGSAFAGGAPPVITDHPASQFVVATMNASFSVAATPPGSIAYQWRFNGGVIPDATNSLYQINNVQQTNGGTYGVVVFNASGSAESSNAVLTVGIPANITQQPADANVRVRPDPSADAAATNSAVFNVVATSGNPPLYFQWRFNGTNLTNSTRYSGVATPTLVVSNVSMADFGPYSCAITDGVGTIVSSNAILYPLVRPSILIGPSNQTVAALSPLTVSVVLSNGFPQPFGFFWLKGSTPLTNIVSDSKTNFFVIPAATIGSNAGTATYWIRPTNRAQIAPIISNSVSFTITVLADFDRDGLPDAYEVAAGLDTNNAADALLDADGDKMSNWAEYVAGTDPTNAASHLRIDLSNGVPPATVVFAAVSNRTYTVEYTDGFSPAAWTRLADVVARSFNRTNVFVDPNWTTKRFYRAITPRQP